MNSTKQSLTKQQADNLWQRVREFEINDENSDLEEDTENPIDHNMEARKLLEIITRHGPPQSEVQHDAMTRLAVYLFYGWGGKSDEFRSLSLLTEAAKAGDKLAKKYLETHEKSGGRSLGIQQC